MFMQTTQRMSNSQTSKYYAFFVFLDNIWKLLIYHTPSCPYLLQSYQLSKQSGFWHTLYYWLKRRVVTARPYASGIYGLCLSVSVCLSVCHKIGVLLKRIDRITSTVPHNSPGTLASWCQRSPRNSTGVNPYEGIKCRRGGLKSATFGK